MSVTAIDAVLSAVLASLRAQPPIAGGRVYEDGDIDELPETVDTALVVGLESAQPREIVLSTAPLQWTTVVRVECFARRSGRRGAVLPATELHAQAHQRLMSDPTLGGVAGGLELVRLAVDRELAATRAAVLVAFYAIEHRSTADTLLPA
jgi:hypothetical protein